MHAGLFKQSKQSKELNTQINGGQEIKAATNVLHTFSGWGIFKLPNKEVALFEW